jgi:hypothetical protein
VHRATAIIASGGTKAAGRVGVHGEATEASHGQRRNRFGGAGPSACCDGTVTRDAGRAEDAGNDLLRTLIHARANAIRGGLTAWSRDARNRPSRATSLEVMVAGRRKPHSSA